LVAEVFNRRIGSPGSEERIEQQVHAFLDLLVRIEHRVPCVVVHETHRHGQTQLASTGLAEDAAA